MAVVACACATPIGAFDPLDDIADVCRRHGVWLHVDAAHGGAAVLSERHRHLVAGLERADSVVWDAHKMLFVPGLCAFVFYRDKAHSFEAFRQDAPYLFDPAAPGLAEYDSGLTHGGVHQAGGGLRPVGRVVAVRAATVRRPGRRDLRPGPTPSTRSCQRPPDFVPLHEPQCNIVVFRHVPALHCATPRPNASATSSSSCAAASSSRASSTSCPRSIDGVGALRVTIINPLTTPDHLDQLLDALRRHGRELLDA